MKNKKKIWLIAHRGFHLKEHENTLEAFQKAIDVGADMIEFDVRKTKDDYLICHHDDNICGVKLSTITYKEALSISAKKGFKLPLVEEILILGKGRIKFDIELKERGYEEKVLWTVNRHLNYNDYVMKSFHDLSMLKVKFVDSKVRTGLLLTKETTKNPVMKKLLELAAALRIKISKIDFVSPHYSLVDNSFVNIMTKMKKDIYVWTVNSEPLIQKAIDAGVSGIITDRPDMALKLLKR